MRSIFVALAIASLALSAGCNRHGNVGEACAAPGLEDRDAIGQCGPDLVCAPDHSGQTGNGMSAHWDTSSCRPRCSSNLDCTAAHETCRAVPGAESVMACQPD